ncbi:MAG: DUF1883 domain-containing protein [Spirochaetales bacterium]|nr:DUF1883 domain-containing protein [Spirochaetales bacterium]
MQHLHKLMRLTTRDVVEVNLRAPAYVFLMDEDNYQLYLDDAEFEYYGGLVRNSQIQLRAPFLDQWHLVIEQENKADDLQVSIRIVS